MPARRPRRAAAAGALFLAVALLGGCGSDQPAATAPATDASVTGTGTGSGTDGGAGTEAALAAAVAVRASGCRQGEALTGSGSVVADGLVVTVAHVVAGSSAVSVTDADGREHTAAVVGLDTVNDLAVLAVDGLDADPLSLGTLAAGDRAVFVVHDAAGRATAEPAAVVRRADLSMADLYGQGTHVRPGFELEAHVSPGDSGAVLVGDDGRAGAVVFATSRDDAPTPAPTGGAGPGRQAWATDISALTPLLDAAAPDTPVPTGACVS